MATMFILGVCLTIIIVFVSALLAIITAKDYTKLPPGSTGWPMIGETLGYMSSPDKFIRTRMAKYSSDIFKTSIAGEKMIILCGASGNKFFFSNEAKLTTWLPPTIVKALSLPNTNPYSSSLTFKFFMEQFHKFLRLESVQHYVSIMDLKAREHVDTNWTPYNEVKAQPLCKDFTFTLAYQLFINYDKRNEMRELAEAYYILIEGIVSVPVNVPGTRFHKAIKAAKVVRAKLLKIIRQKKIELIEKGNQVNIDGLDLLSRVLVTLDQNGISIDEEEIAGSTIGLLFASFSATSSALTFVLHYLADYPEVYAKVLQEQLQIIETKGNGELLTWKDIQNMKYSWNVVCESMRLKPPAPGGYREAITDISYAGFTIPKGWKVHWSLHSTLRDPKYFADPEKFDPSRFDGNLPPDVYIPFGKGPHACYGKEYARIEILVFLHNVVTRFKFRKVNPYEKIIYSAQPVAVDGLRIRLKRHQK